MMDAGRHPRIKLFTYSEVVDVQGYVGNFEVKIKRKPRYVREDICTGCGACMEACVLRNRVPSEFDAGIGKRSAAYIPFAQAVPLVAVIDPESCLLLTRGKCTQKCVQACEAGAIDFEMKEEYVDVKVGAIILATGFDLYDVSRLPQYGYGKYDDVITSLQFERLCSSGGPTGGQILTRDGRKPEAIAFLHCIGSRDENALPYCSRVCCMYALKQAHLAKEKTDAEVFSFYIDIRAAGKGYEEFYKRVQQDGVRLIRGKAAEVYRENGKLIVRAEDTLMGRLVEVPVDMVVLVPGMKPAEGAEELAKLLNVSRTADGFFAEAHPKLAPVATATGGIFLAGCCQGPKDIPDTVAQAGAAASQVVGLLSKGVIFIEPTVAEVIAEKCSGCGECILACPYNAITLKDGKAEVNPALCHGCGTCVGVCVAKAIVHHHFTDEELVAEIVGVVGEEMMVRETRS